MYCVYLYISVSSDEGGIAAGYGVLDSPFLV